MNIKKGDNVKIISGKDRSKTGKVIRVMPKKSRLVVEGLNLRKKHMKPKKQGQLGQTIQIPGSMNISNVMLVCGSCGKPTRVGGRKDASGKKSRICKKCGAGIV